MKMFLDQDQFRFWTKSKNSQPTSVFFLKYCVEKNGVANWSQALTTLPTDLIVLQVLFHYKYTCQNITTSLQI